MDYSVKLIGICMALNGSLCSDVPLFFIISVHVLHSMLCDLAISYILRSSPSQITCPLMSDKVRCSSCCWVQATVISCVQYCHRNWGGSEMSPVLHGPMPSTDQTMPHVITMFLFR